MKSFENINFYIRRICYAKHVKRDHTFTKKIDRRKTYGLIFIDGGSYQFHFENGLTLSPAGSCILYIPKHTKYFIDVIEDSGFYVINFENEEDIDISAFFYEVRNIALAKNLFNGIQKEWQNKALYNQTKCKGKLYELIYLMKMELMGKYNPDYKKKLLRKAEIYINENYTNKRIKVSRLSALCGISETYFRRLFHEVYGISPLSYINNLKTEYAADLIESGYHTISEVAEITGFCDTSHFSRTFKKTMGVNPSEYLKGGSVKN